MGHLPKMPGTWGSLGGLLLSSLIYVSVESIGKEYLHLFISLILSVLLSLIAIPLAEREIEKVGTKDPKWIVIDEVAGMLIAASWYPMWNYWFLPIVAFIVFRFFDIVKPFPVSWADKKEEPIYVMLDDIIAGILSLLVMIGLVYILRVYDWYFLLK